MKNIIFICLLAISCSGAQKEVSKNETGEYKTLVFIEVENSTYLSKAKVFYKKAVEIQKKVEASTANRITSITVLKFEYNKALALLQKAKKLISKIKTFEWNIWKEKRSLEIQVDAAIKRAEKISRFFSTSDWN